MINLTVAPSARPAAILLGLGALTATTLAVFAMNAGPAGPQAVRAAIDAVRPHAAAPVVPAVAPPFFLDLKTQAAQTAASCLADAIYYEAGFEPLSGKQAVAQVVLNRVRDRNFPKTICGVVYEGWKKKTGCQFSFACDGSLVRRAPHPEEFEAAMQVARNALNGYVMTAVGTATHYHTTYVQPWWKSTVVKVAQVGSQIFYRWPGHAGEPQALKDDRYGGQETRVCSVDYRKSREPVRKLAHRELASRENGHHRVSGVIRLASSGAARG